MVEKLHTWIISIQNAAVGNGWPCTDSINIGNPDSTNIDSPEVEHEIQETQEIILPDKTFETQENVPNIRCIHCDKLFVLRSDFTIHMNSVHEGMDKEKCICNICDKTLSLCRIKAHIRSVHEGVKDHQCKTCGFRAAQSSDIKKHIKKFHTDIIDIENPLNFIEPLEPEEIQGQSTQTDILIDTFKY